MKKKKLSTLDLASVAKKRARKAARRKRKVSESGWDERFSSSKSKSFDGVKNNRDRTEAWLRVSNEKLKNEMPPLKEARILHWIADGVMKWWLIPEKAKKKTLRNALLKVPKNAIEVADDEFLKAKRRGRPISHNERAVEMLNSSRICVREASKLFLMSNEGIPAVDQQRRYENVVSLLVQAVKKASSSQVLAKAEGERVERAQKSRIEKDKRSRLSILNELIKPAQERLARAEDIHQRMTWYDLGRKAELDGVLLANRNRLEKLEKVARKPLTSFLHDDSILDEELRRVATEAATAAQASEQAVVRVLKLRATQEEEVAQRKEFDKVSRHDFSSILHSHKEKFSALQAFIEKKRDSGLPLYKIIDCELAISKASSALGIAFRKLKRLPNLTNSDIVKEDLETIKSCTEHAGGLLASAVDLCHEYDIDRTLHELDDVQLMLDTSKLGLANHPPLQPAIDASFGNCYLARQSLLDLANGTDIKREILRAQLKEARANVARARKEVIEYDEELKNLFRIRMSNFSKQRDQMRKEYYEKERSSLDELLVTIAKTKEWLGFCEGTESLIYNEKNEDDPSRYDAIVVKEVRVKVSIADQCLATARRVLDKDRFLAYDHELVEAINEMKVIVEPVQNAVKIAKETLQMSESFYEKEQRQRLHSEMVKPIGERLGMVWEDLDHDEEYGKKLKKLKIISDTFTKAKDAVRDAEIETGQQVECETFTLASFGIDCVEAACVHAGRCLKDFIDEVHLQRERLISEKESRTERLIATRRKWRKKHIDPNVLVMKDLNEEMERNEHFINEIQEVVSKVAVANTFVEKAVRDLGEDAETDTETEGALMDLLRGLEKLVSETVRAVKDAKARVDEEREMLYSNYEQRKEMDERVRAKLRKEYLHPAVKQLTRIATYYHVGANGNWVTETRMRKDQVLHVMQQWQRHEHPTATQMVEADGIPKMNVYESGDGDPVFMPAPRALPAVSHALAAAESACLHASACLDVPVDLTNRRATIKQLNMCEEVAKEAKERVNHVEAFVVGLDLREEMAIMRKMLHATRAKDLLNIPGYDKIQLGEKTFEAIHHAERCMKKALIEITKEIPCKRARKSVCKDPSSSSTKVNRTDVREVIEEGKLFSAFSIFERSVQEQHKLCNLAATARKATREANMLLDQSCAALQAAFEDRVKKDIDGRNYIRREHTSTLQSRIDRWKQTCKEDAHGLDEVPVVVKELEKGQRQLDELLLLLDHPGDLRTLKGVEDVLSLRVQQADACVAQIDFMCAIAEVEHQRLLYNHGNTVYVNRTQRETVKVFLDYVNEIVERASLAGEDHRRYHRLYRKTGGTTIVSTRNENEPFLLYNIIGIEHYEKLHRANEFLRRAKKILDAPVDLFRPREVATAIDDMIKYTQRAASIAKAVIRNIYDKSMESHIETKENIDDTEYVSKSIIALDGWHRVHKARSRLEPKVRTSHVFLDRALMMLEDTRRLVGMPLPLGGKFGGRHFQLRPAVVEGVTEARGKVREASIAVSIESASAVASFDLLQDEKRVVGLIARYETSVEEALQATKELYDFVLNEPGRLRKAFRTALRAEKRRKEEERLCGVALAAGALASEHAARFVTELVNKMLIDIAVSVAVAIAKLAAEASKEAVERVEMAFEDKSNEC
eukprot:g3308.t1